MENQRNLIDKIRANCEFFSDFTDAQMLSMLKVIELDKYQKGENIFKKNDPADNFFVIIEGSVEIYVDRDGRRRSLAMLRDGQVFGEMGILYGHARNASATAATDSVLFNISEKIFENKADYQLLGKIYKGLARIVAKRAGDLIRTQRDDFIGSL
jgi:potassium efflux system protein